MLGAVVARTLAAVVWSARLDDSRVQFASSRFAARHAPSTPGPVMIPEIANTILRRVALVLTVAGIVVCLGPLHLIQAVLRWVETEFEVDLHKVWKETK